MAVGQARSQRCFRGIERESRAMAIERTFAIIKPDAVEKGNAAKILAHADAAGFKIVAIKRQHLSQAQAEGFYAEHLGRGFFPELVQFMSRSPVFLMVLERDRAI